MRYAPVAQLDRVTGYEPVGRGFESLPAYQNRIPIRVSCFGLYTPEGTRNETPFLNRRLHSFVFAVIALIVSCSIIVIDRRADDG